MPEVDTVQMYRLVLDASVIRLHLRGIGWYTRAGVTEEMERVYMEVAQWRGVEKSIADVKEHGFRDIFEFLKGA